MGSEMCIRDRNRCILEVQQYRDKVEQLGERSASQAHAKIIFGYIPLKNKHYKNKLRHRLFGMERGFIELTISTEGEEQENYR